MDWMIQTTHFRAAHRNTRSWQAWSLVCPSRSLRVVEDMSVVTDWVQCLDIIRSRSCEELNHRQKQSPWLPTEVKTSLIQPLCMQNLFGLPNQVKPPKYQARAQGHTSRTGFTNNSKWTLTGSLCLCQVDYVCIIHCYELVQSLAEIYVLQAGFGYWQRIEREREKSQTHCLTHKKRHLVLSWSCLKMTLFHTNVYPLVVIVYSSIKLQCELMLHWIKLSPTWMPFAVVSMVFWSQILLDCFIFREHGSATELG